MVSITVSRDTPFRERTERERRSTSAKRHDGTGRAGTVEAADCWRLGLLVIVTAYLPASDSDCSRQILNKEPTRLCFEYSFLYRNH